MCFFSFSFCSFCSLSSYRLTVPSTPNRLSVLSPHEVLSSNRLMVPFTNRQPIAIKLKMSVVCASKLLRHFPPLPGGRRNEHALFFFSTKGEEGGGEGTEKKEKKRKKKEEKRTLQLASRSFQKTGSPRVLVLWSAPDCKRCFVCFWDNTKKPSHGLHRRIASRKYACKSIIGIFRESIIGIFRS